MNVRQLAELAGLLSVHALQIVESSTKTSPKDLGDLREASRRRSEAWVLRMNALTMGSPTWSALRGPGTDPRCPLIEEILVSEILARITVGVLTAKGHQQGEALARRAGLELFNEHQEARQMALLYMLDMADAKIPAVQTLDRLRRMAERWTDILLGPLVCRFALKHLVFNLERSREYGQGILPYLCTPAGSGLFAAGLTVAFPENVLGVPAHAGFHRDMASAVLRLVPSEVFETDGSLQPLRSVRAGRPVHPLDTPPAKPRQRRQDPAVEILPIQLSFSKLRRQQKP